MWVRTTGPFSFLKERRPYPRGVQSFFLLPFSSLPPSLPPPLRPHKTQSAVEIAFQEKKGVQAPTVNAIQDRS